ncbi:unnamed protein product [Ranitomeya imitator]|uniref:Glutaredoxin-like protein n=1 Tax=Ranitomeya imitator TaxID=111125 RepID=A0ABN9MKY0_9NEOB|nr:unnamed protein product [Ranitomeya imitator]
MTKGRIIHTKQAGGRGIVRRWEAPDQDQQRPPDLPQFALEQVDITLPENTAWYDRYKHDIPVFHLNGQFLMMHRVNIKKLERYLCKLEQDDDVK